MDYKKARRIWRNNAPDILKQGFSVIGGISIGRWTMPKFKSGKFYFDNSKKEELEDGDNKKE